MHREDPGSLSAAELVSLCASMTEENDLVQTSVLRLVENDCAILKRFNGDEKDFVAFLAVISQSVVMDSLRRQSAAKRRLSQRSEDVLDSASINGFGRPRRKEYAAERYVLANEVWGICLRTISNRSGSSSVRDKKIFELHYAQGLSVHEIAKVKDLGLSKTGIEDVLSRLKDRVRATVCSEEREQ